MIWLSSDGLFISSQEIGLWIFDLRLNLLRAYPRDISESIF